MSEKNRLHWVTAVIELLKTLKEAIIPLVVVVVANGIGRERSGNFWLDNLTLLIFGAFIIFTTVAGYIKWKRFVYWFEDGELRIEHGLFVKKKRYIPFERIQSVDYTEGVLHRPFGLVKVKIETAGNSSVLEGSEADLTAVTCEEADRVSAVISEAKRRRRTGAQEVPEGGGEGIGALPDEPEEEAKTLFRMGRKEIFLLATFSGRIGIIFSGIAIFLSQFSDILPYEAIYDEVVAFIRFGVFMVTAAVLALMLIGWVLSVAWTYLGFYGFTVSFDGDDLFISRGLLEKKRVTVPLKRIQAVRVSENPFQKMLGYVSVKVHSAGGNAKEGGAAIGLFPLVRKREVNGMLAELFPGIDTSAELNRIPERSRPFYYRLDFFWVLPLVAAAGYFLFPYGLLALLIIPVIILAGLWQHRSAGWAVTGRQLTVRWREFTLHTVYVFRKRVQSMQERQTIFQKRRNVATVTASFKSGVMPSKAPIRHIDEADADRLMDWYDPGSRMRETGAVGGTPASGGE
ncbi:Bacterial membrane flanked domain protein [Bhargavaea cecembensis DSE10]|uniref:Bacterial membrane flanked domain protein n=1 Tax=Bhargavaea cecembensis DSE10 TaxID=1235279 RepID=M7NTB3_9BACL|nr:PH domain-containing protein [Bhargavaea cecembensis]EMR04935.1 Bacterial membrane flanked domain protein [Bhargavaea cecembensis DSE10]